MKNVTKILLCAILALSMLLCACDTDGGDDKPVERVTREKTGTTAEVTTEAPVEDSKPVELVAEILKENMNLPIGRLTPETGIERPIDNKTSIKVFYQGWPTICAGDGDTLYAVSSLRVAHIDPFGCVAFYKSTDGGKTWSEPKVIADTPTDDRDAGVTYLGDGKVVVSWFTHSIDNYLPGGDWDAWIHSCAYVSAEQSTAKIAQMNALPADQKAGASFTMLSTDGGETWGEPTKVPISAPHGPTVGIDGKTLYYFGDPHHPYQAGETLASGSFYVYSSRDGGRNWSRFSSIKLPSDPNITMMDEPHILQLKNGSFIAAIRVHYADDTQTNDLRIYTATSKDGRTWTELKMVEGIIGTPPHFFETKEGVLVLAYSYRDVQKGPAGARAKLSFDGGKTWSEEIHISESDQPRNGDLGYASTTQLPDGTLLTSYYQAYQQDKYPSFLFTRWRLVEKES